MLLNSLQLVVFQLSFPKKTDKTDSVWAKNTGLFIPIFKARVVVQDRQFPFQRFNILIIFDICFSLASTEIHVLYSIKDKITI